MSESPEEQPSTGVLGRIGSWFSPWRGKGPKSPSENASPTGDQAVKLEGEEESEGSVRLQAREQQGEEEKEESSNPNPLGLSRDIFPSKEEDATQSAHRHSFVLSSTETAEGGPREEEFVRSSKKRIVQGKEREESSNCISVSGNPERNASHLTLFSSSSEQGVVRDSDWAQSQPRAKRQAQALTGKKLHVYVEETSVIKCGQDARTGQEIVRTEVTKSLQVLQKAKSSPNLYSPKSSSSTSAENKRTNVRPTVERESYYSAQGVSLTSHKDSQFELEPDKEQTQTDSMGRKNAARRKIRKNPQVEGGTSPQEKGSPSAESVPEGFPASDNTVTSPQGKSPKTHSGQSSSVNSSSKHNPTFQASPEGVSKTSCPDSNSVTEAGLACVVDSTAGMEDDNSLYKVERKTETPESKRRSIKVSHSEVKFFPKNVPLNPKPAGDTQDFKSALNKTKNEATDAPKAETDARLHHLKKIDEEPRKVVGRIADKISLFERPGGGIRKPFQTPRSADVSPVRSATEKLKVNVLSEQRSRSAERYDTARSSSASPTRERPMSIQECMRIFTEAPKTNNRAALPTKSAMTGMSQKCTLSVAVTASESPELESLGKLDTTERLQANAISEVTLKPDGQDTTDREAKIPIPKEQPKDIKIKDTLTSKTTDQGTKPNNVEANVPAQAPGESAELSNNISQQSKGQSRTGSRSKRRKSREPASPISPSSEKKPDCLTDKPEVTAISQEQVNNTEETSFAPRQPTEKVSLSSDKATGNASDEQPLPDIKQKGSKKELKVVDKQKKLLDSSLKKEIIDKSLSRQEPEPSVNKDEPDTTACISGTKKPFDKDAVISSQKEEKAGGQSLLFTQEMKESSKDSKETPAPSPSPAGEQPIEKQEPLVKNPKFDKDFSMQSEPKSKGKIREPNKTDSGQTQQPKHKDKELINQAETKDVEKLEKSKKTNWTEKKNKQTPELPLDKNAKKVTVSDSGQGISGTEGSVAREDGRKGSEKKEKAGSVKDKREPETSQPKPALESSEKTSSDLPAQTQHITQTTSTHAQNKDAVFAVNQINGEAVSETKSEKEPSKGGTAKTVFTELQTKSTESPGTETESVVVAAEPQPVSVFVEKTENPPDDSCAHGANDAEFSSAKPITKATGAVEKVTVKATNDTPALITARTESISEKESSVKAPTQSFVSKSVKSEGVGQGDGNKSSTVKSVPSDDKISGDNRKITPHHPQCETSKKTGNTSNVTSFKASEKIAKQPADSTTSSSTVTVAEKIAEKNLHPPKHDLSPVANGDISPHPQLPTVQKEPIKNKPSQTPKAPASPEASKLMPNSIQHPPMRKFNLPRGLSKDDSATLQDAPSSWLDVDFPKKRLKVPVRKLSSAVSESNLLDTSGELDDEDFIERIKKLCAPFSLPPRKHSLLRPPQPPFAMPAIKEDHFEKTFDPEEFKFGLRKEKKFPVDTTPGLLAKLQATEVKSGLKPARASLADRSMLVSSMDTHSRLRDKTSDKDEEDVKGEKDDQIRVKSRLEGSCVFSSLNSSKFRGKKNGVQTQAEGTNSGEESPSEAPLVSPSPLSQPTPSSPTATAPLKETLAKQSPALNNREEVRAAEVVVTDSGPPLPSFNDIKLPDYLEKYLPREPAKAVQSMQGQEQVKTEVTEKMTPSQPACESVAGLAAKPGLVHPDAVPPSFPGIPPTTNPSLPELKPPATQPQWTLSKTVRTAKGFHKRPGKMVLFESAPFSGQAYEIHRDVADATAMQLSPLISVKVVRGCWVLYEKPDFQGRCIALEEGVSELTNEWAEPGQETEPQSNPPVLIGSIRLVVSDYSIPHIDLFTEPEGLGRVTPYHDDTIETGSFGIPLSTASIQVHSGVWLVFSDPGFQGMLAVLETGVYPFPETWGFPSPFVGSLRPLKMGGLKVENPNEVKALVYEKPGFEGSCLEIDSDVFSFCENEGGISADGGNLDLKKPKSVGSLKIIGGLWVGYSEPGFEGQQHILEEGEYLDCSSWGGSEQLMSLRPILADFMAPHLKMFSDRDFGELGVNIDLTVPVINLHDTGYGTKTQSLDVVGGVWVVFEEQGFCGEPYVLEKGLYGSPEDWGALQPRVASAMPVVLDDFENAAKFKVQLFSEPGFQGSILALEDSVGSLQDGFSVASCKVLAGNWLAFEGQDFSGRMYVLEQGNYSDLRAMGCFQAGSSILSLQTVGFEFSLPSITLFERCGLRGKRVILTDGSVNLQLAGGCSRVQSLLVEGGMWVLYEEINYRGAQILLKPGELPEWRTFSNWLKIGSLRPLIQKQVHFRLRNRQTGLMMSVTGDLDDVKLMRIQETEETDGLEQIWLYQNGHLHCKLLEECCLSPSGSVTMAGSRVGLIPPPEHQVHLWSITPEGFIRYTPTPDLVLEVKGGHHYDKNQVILNTIDPNKPHQLWNVEVI